ncbi:DUF2442 domain-containing protein [uncultured Paraglaciecola sp.]|uniref:DUF2442 domain-containing protein n=1 Tax=uncultured Paraglaciecola sp. TaxID=1765024 RepID=UPI00261487EC|nr:DUF2442 domain-containing protein [uncultured Paraglaciecola sp.]
MLHIKSAKHISNYKIWVSFDDGTAGEVNLEKSLIGPIFQPLKNINIFSKVSVDPELETIVWPNGADLAPEFVKELHNKQQANLQ